jgi:hypothetical protein
MTRMKVTVAMCTRYARCGGGLFFYASNVMSHTKHTLPRVSD